MKIVKSIVVNFDGVTSHSNSAELGNFLQLPLAITSKKFPSPEEVVCQNIVFKDYFNCSKGSFFGTIAIKNQIYKPIYDEVSRTNIKGDAPTLKEQALLFKQIMCELVDDKIIKDFYYTCELHHCMKWVHIHFLCNIRGNENNYHKKIKQMYIKIRKIVEEDYFVHENMYKYKRYLNISRVRNTEKTLNYMKKYEELSNDIEYLKYKYYIYLGKKNGCKKELKNFV